METHNRNIPNTVYKCISVYAKYISQPVLTGTFSLRPNIINFCWTKLLPFELFLNKSCQKDNIYVARRNVHIKYERSIYSGSNIMVKVKIFEKQVKLQGQILRYQMKGLVTRNAHLKYENPIYCISKVKTKVKVFEK